MPQAAVPSQGRASALPPVLVLPLLLVGTGALLGAVMNMAKLASEVGLSPLAFLAWSCLGSGVLLTVIQMAKGRWRRPGRAVLAYALGAALIGLAAPNLLAYSAVPHVGAGFVALTVTFPPLLTYVGALAIGMERFAALRALGVLLAMGGALVLALPKFSAPDTDAVWVAAALATPVFLAAGNIYRTLYWPKDQTAEALAPVMLIAAFGLLVLAEPLPGQTLLVPISSPLPALLILIQIVVFAGLYLLQFRLQSRGGPVYLSLLGAVAAVFAVPASILLLGEAPPEGLAPGALLIGVGIACLTLGRRRTPTDPTA